MAPGRFRHARSVLSARNEHGSDDVGRVDVAPKLSVAHLPLPCRHPHCVETLGAAAEDFLANGVGELAPRQHLHSAWLFDVAPRRLLVRRHLALDDQVFHAHLFRCSGVQEPIARLLCRYRDHVLPDCVSAGVVELDVHVRADNVRRELLKARVPTCALSVCGELALQLGHACREQHGFVRSREEEDGGARHALVQDVEPSSAASLESLAPARAAGDKRRLHRGQWSEEVIVGLSRVSNAQRPR